MRAAAGAAQYRFEVGGAWREVCFAGFQNGPPWRWRSVRLKDGQRRRGLLVPSPLVGEGAERALASEAGEGSSRGASKDYPSPGSVSLTRDLATLSRKGKGKGKGERGKGKGERGKGKGERGKGKGERGKEKGER